MSTPDAFVVDFPPVSDDQRLMMEHPKRVVYVGAGTKTGKTVAFGLLAAKYLLENPNHEVAWVGPWLPRARTGYEHIRAALAAPLRAGYGKAQDQTMTITLANGARLTTFTGEKPDAIYGGRFHLVLVDEATRQKEAVFHAVRSTVTATGGKIRFAFNTDRTRRHWAIREFLRAQAGAEESYGFVTLPTSRSPYVKAADIEQARRTMPPVIFEALYNAVVMADRASVFRTIDACVNGEPMPGPEGSGILHAEPWVSGRHYVLGVDLARLHDWTVLTILDASSGRVVYVERFTGVPWGIQRQRVRAAWLRYGRCRLIVDATGVGDAVVEEMVREGLPVEPFVFSASSKAQAIENLVVAIENKELSFPDLPTFLLELEVFEFKERAHGPLGYGAPEGAGYHDDVVMSLSLAAWGLRRDRRASAADLRSVAFGRSDTGGGGL